MSYLNRHTIITYFALNILLSVFVIGDVSAQNDAFIRLGPGVYSIGTDSGVQPNYRLGQGNLFFHGTINQNLSIKNVPLTLNGRLSNEPYISGRASYFRVSYDAATAQQNRLKKIEQRKFSIDSLLKLARDSIYLLEQKISYFHLKKLEAQNLPDLGYDSLNFGLPGISLDTNFAINNGIPNPDLNGKLPNLTVPDINKPDIDFQLEKYEKLLNLKQYELGEIEKQKLEIDQQFSEISTKVHFPFLQGIKKVDFGLTSLSKSNFSKNTLPIRGAHIRGEVGKVNYDFASGFSFPNQLFSSLVLDQVLMNSSNVFNLTSFFQVNNVRFVNSGVIEYGEKGRNSLFVEDFYTGRSFHQIVHRESGERSNATNVGGYFTPKFFPNITVSGATGMCQTFNDSIKRNFSDQSSQNAALEWRLPKMKAILNTSYKRIGGAYKGFSQGIYLNGFETKEVQYKQKIGSRLTTRLIGSESKFSSKDSTGRIRLMRQGTLDLNLKIGPQSLFYASGTLIDSQSDSANLGISYLLKSGLILTKKIKKSDWNSTLDYTSALIRGGDSIQRIEQYSVKSGLKFDYFYFSLKGTYQYYLGLNRVYGVNKIIQPEFGVSYKKLDLRVSYQYLMSEQFGEDNGFSILWSFKPSEYFTWQFNAQRWTKSELNFFTTPIPEKTKPWFTTLNMIITLK